MKIKTTYTPSDIVGKDINFESAYALADLQKLYSDLVKAGVVPEDTLTFEVNRSTGAFTVTCEKTID